jgi:hypothetical protein
MRMPGSVSADTAEIAQWRSLKGIPLLAGLPDRQLRTLGDALDIDDEQGGPRGEVHGVRGRFSSGQPIGARPCLRKWWAWLSRGAGSPGRAEANSAASSRPIRGDGAKSTSPGRRAQRAASGIIVGQSGARRSRH